MKLLKVKPFFIIPVLFFLQTCNYHPSVPDDTISSVYTDCRIIIPRHHISYIPIVITVSDSCGNKKNVTGNFTLLYETENSNNCYDIFIKKGTGSLLIPANECIHSITIADKGVILSGKNISSPLKIDTLMLNGIIPDTITHIDSNTVVIIQNDVTVPAGKSITAAPGVLFLSAGKVNIFVEGSISCNGTESNPVCFAPQNRNEPWGGLVISGKGTFNHTIFTGGGGNTQGDFVIGHSGSQGLIHVINGNIEANSSFFVYNTGKGITGKNSTITVDSTLVSFCDMGGEFERSNVTITNSHILFIPDSSSDIVDDDNDALYFLDDTSGAVGTVAIENCVFFHGKDDGIDHNGAIVSVTNCWIEKYAHEGFAGSNGNTATIINSYISACEQGIEAGWGAPIIYVNHCLVMDNDIGVRFGDSYDWGCYGSITVSNSILYNNLQNSKNLDFKTNAPKDSGIIINYSIVDTPNDTLGQNNISQTPIFLLNLLISPDSPGKNAGNDSLDMGLISEL